MNASVTVVLPPVSMGRVANDLRDLTETLHTAGHVTDEPGYGLGGEYGYGVEFANDTFAMNPYYWNDCECGRDEAETTWDDGRVHAAACYQQVIRARGVIGSDSYQPPTNETQVLTSLERERHDRAIIEAVCTEMGLDTEFGWLVHCTCTYEADYVAWNAANPHDPACGIVRPNFWHKPTGSTVYWYKWIGRSQKADLHADWETIITECLASLSAPTNPSVLAGD